MSKTGKPTTGNKASISSKGLPSAIKRAGPEELRAELNRCKAEVVCLRAKFNVEEIAKNRIVEWSTEQMFQQSLINVETELKKFMDSSGDVLRDQNIKLSKENSELKKSNKYLQEEITVLKHRCKALDIECQRLKDENDAMQGNGIDAKAYNTALDEIKQSRETIKQKEELLVANLVDQQTRAKQQSQYDKLVNDFARERAERQRIEHELQDLKKENQSITAEQQKIVEKLREKERENQNVGQDEKIAQLEKERDAKAKEVGDLRKEIESMRVSLSSLKSCEDDKAYLERELAKTKTQLKSARDEVDQLKESQLSDKSKLEEILNQSKLDFDAMRAELETWKSTSQSLTAEIRQLKIELQEKPSVNFDTSPELKELKEKYENEKTAHTRTKCQKEELEIRCHDAFEKITQKEKLLKSLEDNYKEQIARKDKTIGELRRERTMVNPSSDSSKQELQAMREKLEYAMKEMQNIKTEYEMLKKLRD